MQLAGFVAALFSLFVNYSLTFFVPPSPSFSFSRRSVAASSLGPASHAVRIVRAIRLPVVHRSAHHAPVVKAHLGRLRTVVAREDCSGAVVEVALAGPVSRTESVAATAMPTAAALFVAVPTLGRLRRLASETSARLNFSFHAQLSSKLVQCKTYPGLQYGKA